MSNYMVCPILPIVAIQLPVKFHRNLYSYSEITRFFLSCITTELNSVIFPIKKQFSLTVLEISALFLCLLSLSNMKHPLQIL